jgi:hypothetical protein
MSKLKNWEKRVSLLGDRSWDVKAIRIRLNNLRRKGFGHRDLDWATLQANRTEVLDRVQLRGEEYEYMTHSCSKGSALALMQEIHGSSCQQGELHRFSKNQGL